MHDMLSDSAGSGLSLFGQPGGISLFLEKGMRIKPLAPNSKPAPSGRSDTLSRSMGRSRALGDLPRE
jgi:hypothetical protein